MAGTLKMVNSVKGSLVMGKMKELLKGILRTLVKAHL